MSSYLSMRCNLERHLSAEVDVAEARYQEVGIFDDEESSRLRNEVYQARSRLERVAWENQNISGTAKPLTVQKETMVVRALEGKMWCAAFRATGSLFSIEPKYFDETWMQQVGLDGKELRQVHTKDGEIIDVPAREPNRNVI